MKFDFILFENFYWATNHYKDIVLIAEMLKRGGYSVAIADVFQEADSCIVPGVPHISIKTKPKINIKPAKSRYKLIEDLMNIYRRYIINIYLKKVVREIRDMADAFYVGSYHSAISLKWLREFSKNKYVIFWGLRSYRLYEYKVRPLSKVALNSWRLRYFINKNEQVLFFVSDELIKREFLREGIPEKRLIIRPERFIHELSPAPVQSPQGTFKILSIGSLRPDKRIEMILDAIKYIGEYTIHYIIAGRISEAYRKTIMAHIDENTHVETRFKYITEQDFIRYIRNADFLILADIMQHSLVSNGTMNEALLNGIPIIAPNYLPYSYYINKFGVGLTFNPDEKGSLVKTIIKAKNRGKISFYENIIAYQRTLLFDSISNTFNKEISDKVVKKRE